MKQMKVTLTYANAVFTTEGISAPPPLPANRPSSTLHHTFCSQCICPHKVNTLNMKRKQFSLLFCDSFSPSFSHARANRSQGHQLYPMRQAFAASSSFVIRGRLFDASFRFSLCCSILPRVFSSARGS